MRTKLFISHATPVDNRFAAWLAARLELHGYDVWVDIRALEPATDFWDTIETTIRESTLKFLFVASKESVLGNRDGIKKELAIADRVRKGGIADFIIPLRVDDVSFDDFPVEVVRLNGINFNGDWGKGLITLLDYLDKQGVSKTKAMSHQITDALGRWKSATESSNVVTLPKKDIFCSNLFPIMLPENLYIYNDTRIEDSLRKYYKPYKKSGNAIITFVCPNCLKSFYGSEVSNKAINVQHLLCCGKEVNVIDYSLRNLRNDLVNLLNWELGELLYQCGLRKYKPMVNLHSKTKYFFRRGSKSKREDLSRPKVLSGLYKGKYWHFAQSSYFTEFPYEGALFRSHLLFTEDDNEPLGDAHQIKARRSKGRLFFNNDWRNLLQAAMFSHAKGCESITLDLCCEHNQLIVKRESYMFFSDIGYIEPTIDPTILYEEAQTDDDD